MAEPLTEAQRFWRIFAVIEKGTGCWEWPGFRNEYGYGIVSIVRNGKGTSTTATRLLWELTKGPIPKGFVVCHHCDNPPCVRQEHHFLGTYADNIHDAQRKGRMRIRFPHPPPGLRGVRGERHRCAKLTNALVIQIREEYGSGDYLMRDLARRYGIDLGTVSRVVRRKLWRHVA